MKKITQTTITLSALTFIAVPFLAFAQTPAPIVPNSPAVAVSKSTNTCDKVTEKVAARVTKFNEVQSAHDARFTQVTSKLQDISAKLKARGVDTGTLDSQIATLDQKRSKLESDKTAFISKLEESKGLTCGASQGQFKAKVAEAKVLQKAVVADVKDIHDFIKTIRDTIKGMRTQVASSTPKTV